MNGGGRLGSALPLAVAAFATGVGGALLVFSGWRWHVAGYAVICVVAMGGLAFERRRVQRRADERGEVASAVVAGAATTLAVLAVVAAAGHAWYLALAWS